MSIINPIANNGPDIRAMTEAVVNAEMVPLEQALERREKQLTHEHNALSETYKAIVNLEKSAQWLGNEAMLNRQGNYAGRWVVQSNAPERLDVRVTGSPNPGMYQMTIHQLASPQVLVSPPFSPGAHLAGSGNLHIALNGSSWTINLLPDSTYSAIAQSIQLNTRGKIRSTVISGLDGQRLLLTGAEKGAEWRIILSGKGAGETLASMLTEQKAPADALISVDDVELRLPGNIAQQAIRGLSIDLKQADQNQLITIDVSQDAEPMVKAMSEFVENCNQLMQASDPRDEQGRQINAEAPASLRSISTQLRKLMTPTPIQTPAQTPVQGSNRNPEIPSEPIKSLVDLGINTQRNGFWSLDEPTFRRQLELSPYHVLAFLADPQQPVMAVAHHMQKMGDTNNTLNSRATYLSRNLQKLSNSQLKLDTKRQVITERTMRQFIRMDQNMQRLNRTRDSIENAYQASHQK